MLLRPQEVNWNNILSNLSFDLGEAVTSNWLSKVILLKHYDSYILLSENDFVKDWINTYYIDKMRNICSKFDAKLAFLQVYSVDDEIFSDVDNILDFFKKRSHSNESSFDKAFTFKNFIVGTSNQFAYDIALKIADNSIGSNCINFNSSSGMGKTHLLHALGRSLERTKKVLYITGENFIIDFIKSIQDKKIIEFKEKLRFYDVLMIDDIQVFERKIATQEEFLNTMNYFSLNKKKIIVTSNKHINHLNINPDIKARLLNGVSVGIEDTDYQIKMSCLEKHTKADVELLKMICSHSMSIFDLMGNLNTILLKYGQFFTKHDLIKFFNIKINHISIDKINKAVTSYYQVFDIVKNTRKKHTVNARHVAIFILRELTDLSYSDISKLFQKRSHSTIIYAYQSIKRKIQINKKLYNDINIIKSTIK